MKKILTLAAAVMMVVSVDAQMKHKESYGNPYINKRGIELLPKAGDFAISVGADPFLDYVGNIFNNTDGNYFGDRAGISGNYYTITGKYFLQDDRAVRFGVSFDFSNNTYRNPVTDDAKVADDPDAEVHDILKRKNNSVDIFVGYEFRRGKGRLQGVYGGNVNLGFGKTKDVFDWGNPLTDLGATSTDFSDPFNPTTDLAVTERDIKVSSPTYFSVGVEGFAGVEYFFAPQMSIGFELSLGLGYGGYGKKSKVEREYWDAADNKPVEKKVDALSYGHGSTFSFETYAGSQLTLNFYF